MAIGPDDIPERVAPLCEDPAFKRETSDDDIPPTSPVDQFTDHPAFRKNATKTQSQDNSHGNSRLIDSDKQRIAAIDEDIKAPIPENDSLGYPLPAKVKKSEQFFHDACERVRELIRFALADQKDQFERDGVIDWMIRIQAYMHAEQPKSKRLSDHDYTLTTIIRRTFGDQFYQSWRKTIDDKRRETLSNIKALNVDFRKSSMISIPIGRLLMIMARPLFIMTIPMARSAAGL